MAGDGGGDAMDQERTEADSTPFHVRLRQRWPHLTDDDVGRICARRDEVQARLRDAYRGAVADARRQLEQITTNQGDEIHHAQYRQ
jgi:hypothetical protein